MPQPNTLPEYPKPISFASTYQRGGIDYLWQWNRDWYSYAVFWTILGFIGYAIRLKGMW
jgi:hypothetical protein